MATGEIRSPCTGTGPPGGSGKGEQIEDYTPTSYENDLDGGACESDLEAEAVLRERELEDQRDEWSLGFSIDSDGHWHEHQRSPIYQTSPPFTKDEVDDIMESLEADNAAATPATGAATTTSLSSIIVGDNTAAAVGTGATANSEKETIIIPAQH